MPGIIIWLLGMFTRLYTATLRKRITGKSSLNSLSGAPAVFAVWHNRILFLPAITNKPLRKKCTVLISNSRDGEYVTAFARHFGINAVRGSSSKGAVKAFFNLSTEIEKGKCPIITLDGPRGPRYQPHPGAIMLARQHAIPIIPVSVNASSYWQLKSWDGLQIPRPFSRVELIFGEPLYISETLSREEALEQLKQAMDGVTRDK